MKTSYLFPNRFKKIGWVMFILGALLGILYLIFGVNSDIKMFDANVFAVIADKKWLSGIDFFKMVDNNILDEIVGALLIIGSIFIAFSKEKSEDEFIAKIRLESLVKATYVNYAILLFAIIFVYDWMFFWVIVFNMFTTLILFVIFFKRALYKSNKQLKNEE